MKYNHGDTEARKERETRGSGDAGKEDGEIAEGDKEILISSVLSVPLWLDSTVPEIVIWRRKMIYRVFACFMIVILLSIACHCIAETSEEKTYSREELLQMVYNYDFFS